METVEARVGVSGKVCIDVGVEYIVELCITDLV